MNGMVGLGTATMEMRAAERGDADGIVRLLSTVNEWPGFDHQGTEIDYWNWRYAQNPYGRTNELVAFAGDRMVSHAASLPALLKIGDKTRRGSQVSDLFTDPDSRGRGIMESMMDQLVARDRREGVEVEFAFPSPAGYELTTKAGFMEMPVRMGHYELITNPDRFFSHVRLGMLKKVAYGGMRLMKRRGTPEAPEVTISEVTAFPPDIEDLTASFELNFTFMFHRDADYLRWRYEHPESGNFRIMIAERDGDTSGYIVLRPYEVSGHRYMDVVDLVTGPEDRGSLNALMDEAAIACSREGADMLQMWLPTDHPYLPEMGRIGFLLKQPVPGERRMRIMCRALSEDASLRDALEGDLRYHIVLGDSDWV